MYKNVIFLFLFIFLLARCHQNKQQGEILENKKDAELENLYSIMTGSYNSQKQATEDSAYFDISLHMYPIWKDRGNFFYVEQALNKMQEKPYRQRIYELTRLSDSTFSSAIYTLDIDSVWIGKWQNPEAFDSISIEDISLKKGCEVVLKKVGENHYQGATGIRTCISGFRGAMYATSEVEIFEDKIISWDRGFDSLDVQIWGAEKGGYIFDKLQN